MGVGEGEGVGGGGVEGSFCVDELEHERSVGGWVRRGGGVAKG